ncbi:MAG: 50S ribosomal protein L4 [Candidatus Pacearchaeota archaeon]
MNAKVLTKNLEEKEKVQFPINFLQEIRKDIVQKVFEAQKRKQPHGTKIGAGAMYSASGILRRKRHAWKVTYGRGISRAPRKIMARNGSSFTWIGATAAYTRGGREAHPPKVEENQFRKINKKELLIAMNSCFSASIKKEVIEKNYGIKISFFPLIVDKDVLNLKTKEFLNFLKKIFGDYFEKFIQKKKVRAGKGKMRGRKYKKNAGVLFVIGTNEEMKRKGVEVKKVNELKVEDLTLNGKPGRMIIYSKEAIKEIGEIWKKK